MTARPSGTPIMARVGLLADEPDGVVTIAIAMNGPEDAIVLSVPWREMLDLAAEIMHNCVHAAQIAGVSLGEVKMAAARSINGAFDCEGGHP